MYNVFTDFHHASLLNSFIFLFEKRLNGNVYRPIGMEWAERNYWKVYDHPATQLQFLGIGGATPDGSEKLNEIVGKEGPGIYLCHDIESEFFNRAITYEAFMSMPFDVVIASLPQHLEPYKKLCDEHPNHPKLIYQIGNAWPIDADILRYTKNVMASAKVSALSECNLITYHQEFDTNIFRPSHLNEQQLVHKLIGSFVNCFDTQSHFASDWELFKTVEQAMDHDGWHFKCYGGQCRDGSCNGSKELAEKMSTQRFIWHTKNGGDGYGHVLHNAFAVGRPVIIKRDYYNGKLAESLLEDGVTCLAIDNLSPSQIIEKIYQYNIPGTYEAMRNNVIDRFQRVCNFEDEFTHLQEFLSKLI